MGVPSSIVMVVTQPLWAYFGRSYSGCRTRN